MGQYIITDAKSGDKTLLFRNGKEVRLHSAYDPGKEAERSVSAFSKGRASIIVVSGLALGYHVHHLRMKYPDAQIVAVERDLEAAALARQTHPEFLEGVNVITAPGQVEEIFEETDMARFRGVAHYIHRPSFGMQEDFYNAIFIDINRFFTSKISDLLTRFEFEQNWVGNILKNVHHTFGSGRAADLFGRFRGYPGIIVSAGPSLRKNFGLLAGLYDRALIVCVDTAYKVLNRRGVPAHMVMTLDAQKHSLRHFLGLKGPLPPLLADMVSFPHIARSYPGEKIFSTTSKYYTDARGEHKKESTPLMDWIEKFIPPIGDIQSGGSVATSAFDLLLNLGCDPIILVGQDLAYTGREIHCSGTHHNDEWTALYSRFVNLETINQRVVRKRKIKRVEAYGGGLVISDFVFDLYRGWFEDSSRKVPVRVINATEGGARIANTGEESLSSLAARLPIRAKTPASILTGVLEKRNGADPSKLLAALGQAAEGVTIIRDMAADPAASGDPQDLLNVIEEKNLVPVFNPFLKKSSMYIARHGIDGEKAAAIIRSDIESACVRLLPLIRSCEKNVAQVMQKA